ncbi:MAG TPA: glycosyltransferase family 2 protein [Anaerohalosphaeraceae bacterium]|nr:glycosyltransferase family 2 protein [Anaerohalosphaeraceae bacterium]HOL30520.1 glycosyltransferase family 2 protein [Anaerohalosphaeraceae bacterium]HOM75233.1 glycosyltransferase family 2 protein [Anaerohalosphaeraceae bacterium]HPC63974.1 glycosyltransferase family 2 protein [Anaerohalosphaeraceae bacterium]HRS70932.1 glycosyltransferase family 2 protein [Anaerohalosphaeraceae bacterium]
MTGNNTPLVSVLVPYYNGRRYIREAIFSILNQTYPNIEIIVVDDASPNHDESDYIRKFAVEMGINLLVHSENKGIGPTLADAFEVTCGEFITGLSQDDLYKPEKIEKQVRYLEENNLDAVYAVGDILQQTTGRLYQRDTTKTSQFIRSGKAAHFLKLQNLYGISLQGLLAKRSVFEKDIIPIWRDFLLDDWPVHIRLFEKYKVGFMEEPLWTGRSHETNTSRHIWKWFGPQIEVAARMAPMDLKAEAVGGRIGSMARRMLKQNDNTHAIIRLALGTLMLTESPEQHKKAFRVLDKLTPRDKNHIIKTKCQRLKESLNGLSSPSVQSFCTKTITWDNLGKEIAAVTAAGDPINRIGEIGKIFIRLAKECLSEGTNGQTELAVRTALAGIIMVEAGEDENSGTKILSSCASGGIRQLISRKIKLMKSQSGFNLKSVFLLRSLFLLVTCLPILLFLSLGI